MICIFGGPEPKRQNCLRGTPALLSIATQFFSGVFIATAATVAQPQCQYAVYYDTSTSGDKNGPWGPNCTAYGPAYWDQVTYNSWSQYEYNWSTLEANKSGVANGTYTLSLNLKEYETNGFCQNTPLSNGTGQGSQNEKGQSPKVLQNLNSCTDMPGVSIGNGNCNFQDMDHLITPRRLRAEFNGCTNVPNLDFAGYGHPSFLQYFELMVPAEHSIKNSTDDTFVAELALQFIGTNNSGNLLRQNILYKLGGDDECDGEVAKHLPYWEMTMRVMYADCGLIWYDWESNLCGLRNVLNGENHHINQTDTMKKNRRRQIGQSYSMRSGGEGASNLQENRKNVRHGRIVQQNTSQGNGNNNIQATTNNPANAVNGIGGTATQSVYTQVPTPPVNSGNQGTSTVVTQTSYMPNNMIQTSSTVQPQATHMPGSVGHTSSTVHPQAAQTFSTVLSQTTSTINMVTRTTSTTQPIAPIRPNTSGQTHTKMSAQTSYRPNTEYIPWYPTCSSGCSITPPFLSVDPSTSCHPFDLWKSLDNAPQNVTQYYGSQTYPPCYKTTEHRTFTKPRTLCPYQLDMIERMIAGYLHRSKDNNGTGTTKCRMGTLGKLRSDGSCKVDVNRPLQYHKIDVGSNGVETDSSKVQMMQCLQN